MAWTRVLGLDLGIKKTGMAISDELRMTVRPLANLIPKSRAQDIQQIVQLCRDEEIGTIVVGYPLLPVSEKEGAMAKRFRGFSEVLADTLQQTGLPTQVILWDESLSSKDAAARVFESGLSKKKRARALDSEVARILVEEYIQSQGAGKS